MKLLYSFLKDMRLSFKSFYFYLEIAFALIFVAVLMFVLPENFESNMKFFVSIDLTGAYETTIRQELIDSGDNIVILETRDDVTREVEKNRNTVGLIVSQKDGKVIYEYILQGYENQRVRNIIETSVKAKFITELPGFESVTKTITLDNNTEKLSDRLNILPVFLALNVGFMGLFIIASYIFLDKEEGVIKAFAVTPAKVWHYLAGKMGVMAVSGLLSGLITVILIAGSKVHYLHFIPLLIACNLFGSALGLFIAGFFNTMAKAMGWLYASVIILAFASVSYYMPAFSPLIIRILPSYPMLFAFRETLLEKPDIVFIYMNVLGFGLAGIVFFILANKMFKKTLTV